MNSTFMIQIFSFIAMLSTVATAQICGYIPTGIGCIIATASQEVNAFSSCSNIANNHASGKAVMIPTATAAEWSAFRANPPAGVSLSACVVAPPPPPPPSMTLGLPFPSGSSVVAAMFCNPRSVGCMSGTPAPVGSPCGVDYIYAVTDGIMTTQTCASLGVADSYGVAGMCGSYVWNDFTQLCR